MSEAREKYYEELNLKNMITHGAANDYIAELEQQVTKLQVDYNESKEYNSRLAVDNFELIKENTELEQQIIKLKESQKQKQIIKLCERLDKAEQQINGTCKWKYDENYNMYETDCEHAFIFIEGRKSDNGFLFCPYCGKKIEEVLKQEKSDDNI